MAKTDFWKSFGDFIMEVGTACEEKQRKEEEEKAELRKEFEDTSDKKTYTRGTVITAMAKRGWDDYDMRRVLDKVTNSEKAEAAVGLIETGKYDYYEVCRIIERL